MHPTNPTSVELVGLAFDAKISSPEGDEENGRWLSRLKIFVLPKIGSRRISSLHQTDIKAVLAPIWKAKP